MLLFLKDMFNLKKVRDALVVYFDGSDYYTLEGFKREKPSSALCFFVLARSLYTEKFLDFPAMQSRDLKKLLSLKFINNSNVRYQVLPRSSLTDKWCVNVWELKDNVDLSIKFWVPETYLLACENNNNQIYTYESVDGREVYLKNSEISGVRSMAKNAIVNSDEIFSLQAGGVLPSQKIAKTDLFLTFNSMFLKQGVFNSVFLPQINKEQLSGLLIKALPTLALAVVLYFSITSLVLTFLSSKYDDQLANSSEVVEELLKLQEKNAEEQLRINEIAKNFQGNTSLLPFWLVYADLIKVAEITKYTRVSSYPTIDIDGVTKNTGEIIALLIASPYAKNPKMNRPTKIDHAGRESFDISFELVEVSNNE